MSQLSLFGSGKRRLLDDASGLIELMPDFLDATTAQSWFTWLHQHIVWEGERRLMYGREVDVPRLRAYYRSDDAQLPGPLSDALERVRAATGTPFNSVGLNLYRDQRDSVAPHNDRLANLEPGQPIALLSLGATRRMAIRTKQPPRRVLQVDMESGGLLLMSWSTQLHYDHSIPKQRETVGSRISLAFRVCGNQIG